MRCIYPLKEKEDDEEVLELPDYDEEEIGNTKPAPPNGGGSQLPWY